MRVVDSLEFDTWLNFTLSFIHISGDVYAIVYAGPDDHGWLKTVTIDSEGNIGDTIIDFLEFDTGRCYAPTIIHISGNVYAIAYCGYGYGGWLKTVTIETNGNIGTILDDLEFDTLRGSTPCIYYITGTTYAIAYSGNDDHGWLKLVTITTGGLIGAVLASLEFDPVYCREPNIIHVSGNYYAIAYRGPDSDGFLITVLITGAGIGSIIDTWEFDETYGWGPRLIHIAEDVFAFTYTGADFDGYLRTVRISSAGFISEIAYLEFDTGSGWHTDIIHVSENLYAIVYKGPDERGWFITVTIEANGSIGDIVDSFEWEDVLEAWYPRLLKISDGGTVYAVAYHGQTEPGYIKTLVSITAPTVVTNPALNITKNSASLAGELSDDGGEACDCGFEWGETEGYGETTLTESKTTGESFSQPLTGLSSGTIYHFRAFATYSLGTVYGADRTFNTLFVCPYCGETFDTQEELDAHIASEHPSVPYSRSYALSREEL